MKSNGLVSTRKINRRQLLKSSGKPLKSCSAFLKIILANLISLCRSSPICYSLIDLSITRASTTGYSEY